MRRFLPLLCLAAAAAPLRAQAPDRDIDRVAFRFTMGAGEAQVRVRMAVTGVRREALTVAMPIWKPGWYTVRRYARAVESLAAETAAGDGLVVSPEGESAWTVQTAGASEVVVHYELRIGRGAGLGRARRIETDDGPIRVHDTYLFEGPATWLYVPDRLDVPHSATFELPDGWGIATGMTATEDAATFACPDYDVFADCPFHVGAFERLSFTARGVEHEIVLSGFERDTHDRATVVDRFRRIAEASFALMGDPPYDRYVFLVSSPGGSGLEHLNSTSISMMSLEGSDDRHNSIWDSLVAHEFFHLWNVKRLRPRALGPFDYGDFEPNRTRYLWVAEGFTSYYGNLLCVRSGLWDAERFWTRHLAQEINTLQRNPGRKKVSVAEASWTVWDFPYMRRGRTAPDYYNKGQLLALLLDVEIRDATDNAASLDDVMRGLSAQCEEQGRGYADGDVRTWCEKVAGRSFATFFADYVEGVEELPFTATLAKIGIDAAAPEEDGRRGRWRLVLQEDAAPRAVGMREAIAGGR